jgi:hypothetical protein
MWEWVGQLVKRWGPGKTIWSPVLGLGLLGGLIGWLESPMLAAVVVLGFLAFAELVLLAWAVQQNGEQARENNDLRWALGNLRRYVLQRHNADFVYALRRDETTVSKNGDASLVHLVRVRVASDSEPLHFLEFTQGGEPLTQPQIRSLRFEVRHQPGGARLPVEVDWESARLARLWIHLPQPLGQGEETTLVMECTWPGALPELARSGVERMTWSTLRHVERFEYLVILDKSLGRRRDLRYMLEGLPDNLDQKGEAGTWRVEGHAEGIPEGATMRLTLDSS